MTNEATKILFGAAEKGDAQTVLCALDAGADVNAVDKDGRTALMLAASKGHVEVVNIFISTDADVNTTDNNGKTALMHTWENGRTDVTSVTKVVNALISAGAIDSEKIINIKRKNIHIDYIVPETIKNILKDKSIEDQVGFLNYMYVKESVKYGGLLKIVVFLILISEVTCYVMM